MISFDDKVDGKISAAWKSYYKSKSKFVYYNKKEKPGYENFTENDFLDLYRLQYGIKHVRSKSDMLKYDLDEKYDLLKAPQGKGQFIPFYIPEKNQRFVHMINGKSGRGKSTLAKLLSQYYSKFLDVYIISPVQDDDFHGTFLDIKELVDIDTGNDYAMQMKEYERAKIRFKYKKCCIDDPDVLAEMEIALLDMKPKKTNEKVFKLSDKYKKLIKDAAGSLFIFDDNEAEGQRGKLKFLMDSQLLTGRHDNINMLVLNHQCNNGLETRNLINESNIFTIFDVNRFTKYFMTEYLEMNRFETIFVKKLLEKSRSVTIYKDRNLILSENKIVTF